MMIISADKNKYSPPEYNVIASINSPIPLVLVTRLDDFEFNPELLSLDEYILCDFSEYEWNRSDFTETHIFGKNTEKFAYRFPGYEWDKFDGWVKSHPPKIYFKRELLSKNVTDKILPIEYPYYGEIPPTQTREEYNNRFINAFHYWGRSAEQRVKAHADFWLSGAAVCDNIYYFNDFITKDDSKNKWVSLHIPHYARVPLETLMAINQMSKLGLSMPGSGKKCYRCAEVSTSSILIKQKTNMAYQFPWIDGLNCIEYTENPVTIIEAALSQPEKLYDIYVNCVANARNYQFANYTRRLESIING